MTRTLPQGFRRKNSGSLEYRFMIGKQRFSVSGSTVGECRRKEREKRDLVAAGQYIRNDKVTLNEYFAEWEKAHERTVKESTILSERIGLKAILSRIGNERIANLERRQILALQADLAKQFSTSGVNYRIRLLNMVLKAAVLDEVISKNPCEGVRNLKRIEPLARDTIHRALTIEEQNAFFNVAADHWLYELFCFLIQTGCRVGEALALQWSDIDVRKGVIRIRRTLIDTAEGVKVSSSTKSKAGMRDIPMNEDIKETLRRQRQKIIEVFGNRIIASEQEEREKYNYVFLSIRTKGPMRRNAVEVTLARLAKKAGIDHVGPHCFRDTFATRALEHGMSPQTLKEILGHSSFSMTMDLYAHVMENTKKQEMNRIKIAI